MAYNQQKYMKNNYISVYFFADFYTVEDSKVKAWYFHCLAPVLLSGCMCEAFWYNLTLHQSWYMGEGSTHIPQSSNASPSVNVKYWQSRMAGENKVILFVDRVSSPTCFQGSFACLQVTGGLFIPPTPCSGARFPVPLAQACLHPLIPISSLKYLDINS